MLCERCRREIHKFEQCNYCNKKICTNCAKSSRRVNQTTRLVICKDCWSKMPHRKAFKATEVKHKPEERQRRY